MEFERKCANCGNSAWRDGKSPITDVCIQCRYVDMNGHPEPGNWKPKTTTNADRIRGMSDEELAEALEDWQDWGGGMTKEWWLEWLKREEW